MSSAAKRRLLHALTSGILLCPAFTSWSFFRAALIGLAVVAAALDRLRRRNRDVGRAIERRFPVFRPIEATRPSGAVWLLAGYMIASWFPPSAATAGILVAAVADPTASLVGSGAGALAGAKTWRGTLAAALVSAVALWGLGFPTLAILGAAGVAAAAERWPGPANDNLVIAPAVAGAAWFATWVAA